eukprot:9836813-Alexandrium_andersonii.AAC.1
MPREVATKHAQDKITFWAGRRGYTKAEDLIDAELVGHVPPRERDLIEIGWAKAQAKRGVR